MCPIKFLARIQPEHAAYLPTRFGLQLHALNIGFVHLNRRTQPHHLHFRLPSTQHPFNDKQHRDVRSWQSILIFESVPLSQLLRAVHTHAAIFRNEKKPHHHPARHSCYRSAYSIRVSQECAKICRCYVACMHLHCNGPAFIHRAGIVRRRVNQLLLCFSLLLNAYRWRPLRWGSRNQVFPWPQIHNSVFSKIVGCAIAHTISLRASCHSPYHRCTDTHPCDRISVDIHNFPRNHTGSLQLKH